MDRSGLNAFNKLRFFDTRKELIRLRVLDGDVSGSNLDPKVKALRTNVLKRGRELRDAALFCYGMSCYLEQSVNICPVEESDYDFVARWESDPVVHFAPVQLKEVVPERLNPEASIQQVIDKLAKYPTSNNLTVAIKLNRREKFEPDKLIIPKLNIASLWIFAAITPDQSRWFLYGNILEKAEFFFFEYPSE